MKISFNSNNNYFFNKILNNLNNNVQRLSSGIRISKASDGPAELTLKQKFITITKSNKAAVNNIKQGIDYILIAEGALNGITNNLQRIRELILKGANDTNTYNDKLKIQKEIDELIEHTDQIPVKTKYNNITPLQIPPDRLKNLTTGKGYADIVFIIDGGGSMLPYITNVKNNLNTFINYLESQNLDVRISIVANGIATHPYGDNIDATGMVVDSTDNYTILYNALSTFPSVSGTTNDTFAGLLETSGIPGYNISGTKEPDAPTRREDPVNPGKKVPFFQILVTDNYAESQLGYLTGFPTSYGPERESALASILQSSINPITTYVITNPSMFSYYDDITNATGGDLFNINLSFSSNLVNIAQSISSQSLIQEGKLVIDYNSILFQVSSNIFDYISIDRPHINNFLLGISGINLLKPDVNIDTLLNKVDAAISKIDNIRAKFGASQNRLESTLNNLIRYDLNINKSISTIEDTEFPQEIYLYLKNKFKLNVNLNVNQSYTKIKKDSLYKLTTLPSMYLNVIKK